MPKIISSIIGIFTGGGLTGNEIFEFAKGGAVPGGLMPLPSAGFRIRQAVQAMPFAHGGVVAGGFTPLSTGFAQALMESSLPSYQHGGVVHGPQFAFLGDNPSRWEAVVPLPESRAIPVEFKGTPSPAQQEPRIDVQVKVDGHIIPRLPTMTEDQIISVVVTNYQADGTIRRMIKSDRG